MAQGGGLEPPLARPKPAVLPLDDPRTFSFPVLLNIAPGQFDIMTFCVKIFNTFLNNLIYNKKDLQSLQVFFIIKKFVIMLLQEPESLT